MAEPIPKILVRPPADFVARARCAAAVFLLMALLTGCGVQGPIVVRRPVVPAAIGDLSAQQRGDAVVLSFTLPQVSTQQQPLPEPPEVDIYRRAGAAAVTVRGSAGTSARKDKSAQPVETIPGSKIKQHEVNGRVEFVEPLPAANSASGAGQQLTYTVRTRASNAHVSAESNAAAVRIHPAPTAINDLKATVTETAVVLSWTPPIRTTGGALLQGISGYRVYRTEIVAQPTTVATGDGTTTPSPAAPQPALLAQVPDAGYRDTNFALGHTYVYTVRTVTQVGGDSFDSADSNSVNVVAKDVFPPATPEGLEAVVVPATAAVPAYVDLSWAISSEADFAGYTIYRSEQPDAEGQRLNADLLPSPTFRDMNVAPGRRYYYRVAAVDSSGNESPRSPAVSVDLQGP